MTLAAELFSFQSNWFGNDSLTVVLTDAVSVIADQTGETVVFTVFPPNSFAGLVELLYQGHSVLAFGRSKLLLRNKCLNGG